MPFSVSELYEATIDYSFRHGLLVPLISWSEVRENLLAGYQICRWYEAAPSFDEKALPAYEALRQETDRQYHFMTGPADSGGLDIEVVFQENEAYSRVAQLVGDLCGHRRIRVQHSGILLPPHPFFTEDEHDRFRAVHEVFGHAAIRAEFDSNGAEAAWLKHSTMFTPLARRAMATETRAQMAVIAHTQKMGIEYPGYKTVLLPVRFSDPGYEAWQWGKA